MKDEKLAHYQGILEEVAKHSSDTERRAEEAERETDKLKKAQFMESHIGEIFEGTVSGVTGWGMFVELPNTCEGLVPASSMEDDFYIYDENNFCLVGERTGRTYKLGQTVKVKVFDTDRLSKTIDFRIVSDVEDDDMYDPFTDDDYEEDYYEEDENGRIRLVRGKSGKAKAGKRSKGIKSERPEKKTAAKLRAAKVSRLALEAGEADSDRGSKKEHGKKAKSKAESMKKADSKVKGKSGKGIKSKDEAGSKGRKVYKVHKYKKSATSKAARSAQGKRKKK